jgi:hypothetical protein
MPVSETVSRAAFLHEFVEWYLACAMLVVGTSLVLRPRIWINALVGAASHPIAPLLSGLYALLVGLAIVILHNLWTADLRIIATLVGWASVALGTLFLVIPESYAWILRRMPITPGAVAFRGVVRLLLGGAIMTYLLSQA